MGIVKQFVTSYKKSKKIQRLQKAIASSNEVVNLQLDSNSSKDLLGEYIEFCKADSSVAEVISLYSVSDGDLRNLYQKMQLAGLGQFIKGHYASLSSLAYIEPLQYILESERRGTEWLTVVGHLLMYWEGKIPQRGLHALISE